MVAIVGGEGLGLFNTSLNQLNGFGGSGSHRIGNGNDRAYVNAVTGNLVIQSQDDYLAALGLDVSLMRTYNSRGLLNNVNDDNQDLWQLSFYRRLSNLPATGVTTPITREGGDGHQAVFTYDTTKTYWIATDGSGAHDTLKRAGSEWIYEDTTNGVTEIYDDAGMLRKLRNRDGQLITLGYTGTLVTSLVDGSGQTTTLTYTGNNLTQITTAPSGGSAATRVRYAYDGSNRLTQVKVDLLNPNDNTPDAADKTYITTYEYLPNTRQITRITQSDGSELKIGYIQVGSEQRIASLQQLHGYNGSTPLYRTTTFNYDTVNRRTDVYDNLGAVTSYFYDAKNRLTKVVSPQVENGLLSSVSYSYDELNDNITQVTTLIGSGESRTVNYAYDPDGNLTEIRDQLGNTVRRTYNSADQLLTETQYLSDPNVQTPPAEHALTTRYVYDAEQHLRYVITPEGRVTAHAYFTDGLRRVTLNYGGNGQLYTGTTFTEAALDAWTSGLGTTRNMGERIDYTYDALGQLFTSTRYTALTTTGGGSGTAIVTNYVYSHSGELLSKIEPNPTGTGTATTAYTYDGLGRLLIATDATGRTSTTLYNDASSTVVVTSDQVSSGAYRLQTTSVYNKAGERISQTQVGGGAALGTTLHFYDANGRMRMAQDPTGARVHYVYDARGRQVGQINAEGELTETVYNGAGQVIRTIRYDGRLTEAVLMDGANPRPLDIAALRGTLAAVPGRPSVDLNGTSVAGQHAVVTYPNTGAAMSIVPNVVLTDSNSTNLAGITVTIDNIMDLGQETLSANAATAAARGVQITTAYNGKLGTLTLSAISGARSLADYQAVLATLQYRNAAANPNYSVARQIRISSTDGELGSIQQISTVTVVIAPVMLLNAGTTPSYNENGPAVKIAPNLTLTDPDSSLTGATVSITNFKAGDRLTFSPTTVLATNGIQASYNASTGVLTLSSTQAGTNRSATQYREVLRAVMYDSTSDDPTTPSAARSLLISASDGTQTASVTATVNVTAVNDAPVISLNGSPVPTYAENGTPVKVAPNLQVSDVDNTSLTGVTVTITNFKAGDRLAFSPTTALANNGIQASYNSSTGVLTLSTTQTGTNRTPAQYQAVLQALVYDSTSDDPTTPNATRSIQITANDGALTASVTAAVNITAANDAPVISLNGSPIPTYTENGTAVTVVPNLQVSDADNTSLTGVTVTITNFKAGDRLTFSPTTAPATNGIQTSYNSSTGVLTLSTTQAGTNRTPAQYQAVLRAMVYDSTSNDPTNPNASRSIQISASDGALTASVTATVNITAVNDAPLISLNGSPVSTYTENDLAVKVAANLSLTDTDNISLSGVTVTITNFGAGDRLAFSPASTLADNGIQASYNASTGVLTLSTTQAGTNRSPAQYQAVLRAMVYDSTSENPTSLNAARIIRITANDGALTASVNATVNITPINDPPVLSYNGTPVAYQENAPQTGIINGTIGIADVDGTKISSATVRLVGVLDAAGEYLFINDAVLAGSFIGASYNPATGLLSLTSTQPLPFADYLAVLQALEYQSLSDNPSPTRTVEISVNDGAANSNTITTAINITAVNDAPVIDANSQTSGIDHIIVMPNVGNNLIIGGLIEITDPDNTEISSARAEIVGVVFTAERLTIDEAHGITASYWNGVMTLTGSATLAEYKEVLSTLNYQRTLLGTTMLTDRTVQITVNDGQLDSQVATITVLKRGSTLPAGMMAVSQGSPSVQPQSVAARPVPAAAATPQQEAAVAGSDEAAVELQQSGSAAPVEPQPVVLQWATSAPAQSAVEPSGVVPGTLQWQTSSPDTPAIPVGSSAASEAYQGEDVTEPADAWQPDATDTSLYGSGLYSPSANEEAESGLGAGMQMMLMSVTSTPTIGAATNRVTDYIYDAAGRLVYTLSDDTEGAPGSEVLRRTVVERSYDGAGRLIGEVAFAKRVRPDVALNAAAINSELGTTGYRTDVANNRTTRYFYDKDGLQAGVLDAEGYLTEQKYDAAGRLKEQTRYATATSTATSPINLRAVGTLEQLRPALDAANDQTARSFFDARGLRIGSIDAMGYVTQYSYNGAGVLTQERRFATPVTYVDGAGFGTYVTSANAGTGLRSWAKKYTYDDLGRILSLEELSFNNSNSTNRQMTLTTYEYNAVTGFLDRTTKAAGSTENRSTTYEYDALGRVLKEVGGEGSEVILAAGGNTTAIENVYKAYGSRHDYDTAGRRIRTIEASSTEEDGKVHLYFYDRDGRLRYTVSTGSTAGRGEVTETLYNAFGEAEAITQYAATISLSGLSGGTNFATVASRVASIVNPTKDRTTTLDYTLRGQLKQKTDAESHITRQIYNAFGQLANRTTGVQLSSVGAPVDRLDTWTYDRKGLLKTSVLNSGGGNQAIGQTLSYDAFGRIIEKKDGMNRVWKTGYDQLGRQVTTTDPLNNSTGPTTYDAFSRVLTQTDKLGKTTSYSYNTNTPGRSVVTVTTPEGVVTTTTYDRHGSQIKIQLSNNGVNEISEWTYDRNGRLTSQIIASGILNLETKSEYSKSGLLIGSLDANGIRTSYAYDAANRVMTRTVDPSSYPLPNGTTGTKTGALNLSTQYAYDAFGSVIKTTDAEGVVTETIFDRKGQTAAVIVDTVQRTNKPAPLLLATVYSYDTEGRTLELKEGVQAARVGGVLTYSGAATRTTQYVYDKAGRRVQEILDPAVLKITTDYVYDKNGNLISKKDAAGNIWRSFYDELNQEVFSVDPERSVTERTFDAMGRLAKETRYAGLLTATLSDATPIATIDAAVDAAGFKNLESDRSTRFIYNGDGNQVFQIDALGFAVKSVYDAAGRVVETIRYANQVNGFSSLPDVAGESDISVTVSAQDQHSYQAYDSAGRKTYEVDALRYLTQYKHDDNGRVIKKTRFALAVGAGTALTHSGLNGYVSSLTVQNRDQDQVTRQFYDAAGWLRYSLRTIAGSETSYQAYVTEVVYDRLGQVLDDILYMNAMSFSVDMPMLSVISATITASTNTLDRHEVKAYDGAGRVLRITDAFNNYEDYSYTGIGGRKTFTNKNGATWTYSYDGSGRLIEEASPQDVSTSRVTVNNGVPSDQTTSGVLRTKFVYDGLGNLKHRIENSGASDTTRSRVTSYIYDRVGRQVQVRHADVVVVGGVTYGAKVDSYDVASGQASASTLTSTTIYDGLGNAVIARDVGDRYSYKTYDALGRLRFEVDGDLLLTEYVYDAFGNQRSVSRYSEPGLDATSTTIGGSATLTSLEQALTTQVAAITQAGPVPAGLQPAARAALDKAQALIQQERASLARTVDSLYDLLDRKIAVLQPETFVYQTTTSGKNTAFSRAETQFKYDAFGAVNQQLELTAVNPANQAKTFVSTHYFYDRLGNRNAQVDAKRYLTQWEHTAAGELKRQLEWANPLSSFTEGQRPTTPTTTGPSTGSVGPQAQTHWSSNFAQGTAGMTRSSGTPAQNYITSGGALLVRNSYAQASASASRLTGDETYLPSEETVFRFSLSLGSGELSADRSIGVYNGSVTGAGTYYHRLLIGKNGSYLYATDGTTLFSSARFELARNQTYILEICTDGAGSTAYLYASGSSRESGFKQRLDTLAPSTSPLRSVISTINHTGVAPVGGEAVLSVSSIVEANGNNVTLAEGTAAARQERNVRETTFSYDALGRQTAKTQVGVFKGNVDSSNSLSASMGDITTTIAYDKVGNVVATTDGNNARTLSFYDALGRLRFEIGAIQSVLLPGASQTSQRGTLTEHRYDELGNEVSTIRYANGSTHSSLQNGYLDLPAVTSNAAHDQRTYSIYDGLGRVTRSFDAEGFLDEQAYDKYGHVVKAWQSFNRADGTVGQKLETYQYDGRGQQIIQRQRLEDGNFVTREVTYNAFGELVTRSVSSADVNGTEQFKYDANGRLWRSNENGVETIYLYDLRGNTTAKIQSASLDLRSVTTPQSILSLNANDVRLTETVYDELGRAILQRQPKFTDVPVGNTTYYTFGEPNFLNIIGKLAWQYDLPQGAVAKMELAPVGTEQWIIHTPEFWNTSFLAIDSAGLAAGNYKYRLTYSMPGNQPPLGYWTGVLNIEEPPNPAGNAVRGAFSLGTLNGSPALIVSPAQAGMSLAGLTSIDISYYNGSAYALTRFAVQSLGNGTYGLELPVSISSGVSRLWFHRLNGVGNGGTYYFEDFTSTQTTRSAAAKALINAWARGTRAYSTIPNGLVLKSVLYRPAGSSIPYRTANLPTDGSPFNLWTLMAEIGNGSEYEATFTNAQGQPVNLTSVGGTATGILRGIQQSFSLQPDSVAQNAITEVITPTVQTVLDRWGNVVSETSATGGVTTYRYDHENRLIESVAGQVGVTDLRGNSVTTSTAQRFVYDHAGRLIATINANGALQTKAYDITGALVSEKTGGGSSIAYVYDSLGRVARKTDQIGFVTTYEYDRKDQLKALRTPTTTSTFDYDALGNRKDDNGVLYVYDADGNVLSRTEQGANGRIYKTTYLYDALGRKKRETDAKGGYQTWAYDYFGRVTSSRGLDAVLTGYAYDFSGAKTLETRQDASGPVYKTFSYYQNGLLNTVVNHARQAVTTQNISPAEYSETNYRYDAAGRIKQQRVTTYVTPVQNTFFEYDAAGRLTKASDIHSAVQYSYDAQGNRRSVIVDYGAGWGPATSKRYSIYEYDDNDRLSFSHEANIVVSSGTTSLAGLKALSHQYGAAGQRVVQGEMTAASYTLPAGMRIPDRLRNFTTPASGTFQSTFENYAYDGDHRLKQIIRSPTDITKRDYDGRGRLVRYEEGGKIRTLTYDGMTERLDLVTDSSGGSTTASRHVYDLAGNLETITVTGLPNNTTGSYIYTNIASTSGYVQSKIESKTVNSNGTNTYTTTLSYDFRGNLISVTPGQQRTFLYDTEGRILRKFEYGSGAGSPTNNSVFYLFQGGNLLGSFEHGTGSGSALGVVNFGVNPTPISDQYPSSAPGNYVVQSGDTLRSIAAAVYGDANLWYIIADGNNVRNDGDLTAGQLLKIPNKVADARNASDTFKPYNSAEIIGDVNPGLPEIPMPPPPKKKCGGLLKAIIVVVAIVVTVYTAGAASAALGATATTSATVAGSAVAGAAVAGAAGAAAGSIASQLTAMAFGMQSSFSWSAVGTAALSGGLTAGVTAAIPGLSAVGSGKEFAGLGGRYADVARVSLQNAVGQGINIALGQQERFSWSSMAAAAVTAGVFFESNRQNGQPAFRDSSARTFSMSNVLSDTAVNLQRGIVQRGVQIVLEGKGKLDLVNVAADAFGNALGNSIVGAIQYGERVDAFAEQGLTYGKDDRGSYIVSSDAEGNQYNSYARGRFADGALAGGGSIGDLPGAFADENLQRALNYSDAADYVADGGSIGRGYVLVGNEETGRTGGYFDTVVTSDGRELNLGLSGSLALDSAGSPVDLRRSFPPALQQTADVLGYGAEAISAFSAWADNHAWQAEAVVSAGSALIGGGGLKTVVQKVAGQIWKEGFNRATDYVHQQVAGYVSDTFTDQMVAGGYSGTLVDLTGQVLGEVAGTVTDAVIGGNVLKGAANVRQINSRRYEVGEYGGLRAGDIPGDGLQNHHVPQKAVAKNSVPGYPQDKNAASGPALRLEDAEHSRITAMQNANAEARAKMTPRELLADDARMLRSIDVPNDKIQDLIRINKEKYGYGKK